MVSNRGYAHSEISYYGDAAAPSYQQDLKYRPSGGGWTPWAGLLCSVMLNNNMNNYDARKLSDTRWDSVAGQPPAGDC